MHTAFTGSARKARQVNLSGRHVANPFANLPGAGKSLQSTGTQNTLANAQADRVRRQQERDRQNAVKRIQRVWRGYASRQEQKQEWREHWDQVEVHRLDSEERLRFDDAIPIQYANIPYDSVDEMQQQLRLLVYFLDLRNGQDMNRMVFFGRTLEATAAKYRGLEHSVGSTRLFVDFSRIVARKIEHIASTQPGLLTDGQSVESLLQVGRFVVTLIPNDLPSESYLQFHALSCLLQASKKLPTVVESTSQYIMTILSQAPVMDRQIYKAFATELLTTIEISSVTSLLEFLQNSGRQKILSESVVAYVHSALDQEPDTTHLMWILSYLLYINGLSTSGSSSFTSWIQAISILLSRCANDIALRLDEIDEPMTGSGTAALAPLHPFVRQQILSLAQKASVESIVEKLRVTGGDEHSVATLAKPLANYAVALLRAFPNKALNIRMWLYRSSPQTGKASLSTIQYLWQAAQATKVFRRTVRDSRSVLSVLTEAAPEHHQIGRDSISAQDTAIWQEEWRIVLLFLELYTFILKIMDDEEFFALDESQLVISDASFASPFSQGALPLRDVASLTTFLKHLVFPLYWNAADLAETNEIEEIGGISALFGISSGQVTRQVERREPKTLAGNGVSQAYLKDRVTALLRMLYERDSRRNFLPEGFWLMTNHVDMHGFISAVVAEEERRHEIDDDDDDELNGDDQEDLSPDESSAVLQNFTSMFGIRPPHTPRNQTSRSHEMMSRLRERAKRRRQAESLVPRIEILRNLPFFIPFETRVQIFREFVYRDQFRRRNGFVDPDEWRVSVASATQGRGIGGHLRGMESINRHRAEIHRESVFEDAFESFYEIGEDIKEPIQISFIDQFGTAEAGIDGGGVTKEFLMSVTGEAFDPNQEFPMFVENEQRYIYPNPKLLETTSEVLTRRGLPAEDMQLHIRDVLRRYEFLGRIVGKCMYEGILIDISFAGFFLLKWALTGGTTSATTETAYRASINDLKDFDEQLYQGLLKLKNYKGDVESDFGLNFTASDEVDIDQHHRHTWTKDLVPNGSNLSVTNSNRLVYIDKITRYRLQQQPLQVTNAFLKGLGQVIQPMWLAMFNQRELQKLVGGDNAELDINDLRRNTQYGGLYVIGDDGLEHPTISLFWKVLREMSDADRRKVLKFVTSTPRAPLLGFSHLNPKFSIRDSSEDQTRLPSTSTCVNLLKLPRYGDERTMREKLLYAANSGAGFDLS